jgi:hypothetical protein
MGFHITYKNLFEIKLLHHFFLNKGEEGWDSMTQDERDTLEAKYNIRNILEIKPTEACAGSLRSHYCIFKNTPSGFIVGIKAQPDEIQPEVFNPFSTPDHDLTFRFTIKLKDYNFLNYTALSLRENTGMIYVFKNYKVNNPAIFPSLSAIQPVFEPGKTYYPGDMLSNHAINQTRVFTALLKTSTNTSTATDWLNEEGNATTPLSYANDSDRYPLANGILNYRMKVENAKPAVTIKNEAGETVNPKTEIIPGDFYEVQADLRNFPGGFYSAHIESPDVVYQDDYTFYLVQQNEVPFGMIEVRVKSNMAGFDLLDQGHLLSPVYELRFRNRRTHWRYFGKIFDLPFEVPDPLPLTRFGHIEIVKPPEPEDTKIIMLPNPSEPVIKPEALILEDEKKYYSDIHIN